MIAIQLPNGKEQTFSSELALRDFCSASFQNLSRETVESLRDSLIELSPLGDISPQMCANLGLEATKLAVKTIEADCRAKRTKLELKSPLPKVGCRLKELCDGTPSLIDILPSVKQLHLSSVAIHDSMHIGPRHSRVDSKSESHTAIHVLGHLAQIIMYLPQLRPLALQARTIFKSPASLLTSIIKPTSYFTHPNYIAGEYPKNPTNSLLKSLIGNGGSLHLK